MRPEVMRNVRRTELEASSESRFQLQFARTCHALARVMRCLRLHQEEMTTKSITLFPEATYQTNRDEERCPTAPCNRPRLGRFWTSGLRQCGRFTTLPFACRMFPPASDASAFAE